MVKSLIPVILAGGKGERFWPLSRKEKPKQFLCLDGSDRSLLQATADRLLEIAGGWDNLWVITSAAIERGVREQLPELPENNLLIEPEGKDTAPAVAWGSIEISKRYGRETILGFFPADHWIGDRQGFEKTLQAGIEIAANQEAIVTLGIEPNHPSTGYGYIERGEQIGTFGNLPAYKVSRFTEKPDRDRAESFIQTGRFTWNSGMFLFRAGVLLDELHSHAPQIIQPLLVKGKEAYAELEKKSIDYALMEKTALAYVLPANFGWDDLGDWNSLERLLEAKGNNVEIGKHLGLDTRGAIIYNSHEEETIVTIGLEDIVIVRDRHVTLVVNKNRTQDIKKALQLLQQDPDLEKFL
jgi:mannose-1-phosphate guanylyltransferase